jgi:hypothetical protein
VPAEGADANARRSVVPQAAGRSLWLAAAWTGAGTALIAAVVAIAAVGICWLPASGAAGNAGSAIRAGVLTFLAALHGGLTVDGVPTNFVPLGMTIAVGLLAWRAGTGLADASSEHDDPPPVRLIRAAALQAAVFAGVCGVAAQLSTLGTSSASVARTTIAGFLLFAATGTVAFVRSSGLRDEWAAVVPERVAAALRAAAAGVAVYVGAGALLLAGSLLVHHGRVELLSQHVGGGWSGAPVLLLGVLSAPNAAVAGASYLAGPGFAVGSGSGISLGSTVHGTLPAFPLLGAVPSGPANSAAWLLAAATPIVAGLALVRIVRAAGSWSERWLQAGFGLAGAGVVALLLGWVSGGALGPGRLSAVGVSPWQFGFAVAAGTAAVAVPSLAGLAAVTWWRGRSAQSPPVVRAALSAVATAVRHKDDGDADRGDQLAG